MTVMPVSVACPTVAVVEEDMDAEVAVTVEDPSPALVASPLVPVVLLITSTGAEDELQFTIEVTSCELPSV